MDSLYMHLFKEEERIDQAFFLREREREYATVS